MMSPRGRPDARPAAGGFALILTLLVLSVLAIVAISYLASMSAERATTNAYANKSRAEATARAGADAAMATLRAHVQSFPDSATTWDPAQTKNAADGTTNGGTSLYLRAVARKVPDPANSGGPEVPVPDPARENRPNSPDPAGRDTFVLPLVSGVRQGYARRVTDRAAAVPDLNTAETRPELQNYAEINPRRFKNDTQGWIGSPPPPAGSPAPTAPLPVRAPWVEIKVNPGNSGKPADEIVTGRYAFWVEDESFRANLNLVSPPPVPVGTNDPFRLLRPEKVSLPGLLTFLGDGTPAGDATKLFDTRAVYPATRFPDPRALDQSDGLPAALRDGLRYLTALDSGGLNLSRHGSRRLNLNRIVKANSDTRVAANRTAIRKELDQIIQPILFHAPKFGQRFYRGPNPSDADLNNDSLVTGDHETIYLNKIAANLRDYLDNDNQPTVVEAGGAILDATKKTGKPPILAIGGDGTTNDIWAIGKEPLPLFTEYLLRVKQIAPAAGSSGTRANYNIEIDHYLEFWNLTNRDLTVADLGPAPYISITDQPAWDGGGSNSPPNKGNDIPNDESRDIVINLTAVPGLVFRAGAHTVITTDPNPPPASSTVYNNASFIPDRSRLFYAPIPASKRVFTGVTTRVIGGRATLLMLARQGDPNINSGMDLDTEIVLGNNVGYLDSQQNAGVLQAAMLIDGYRGGRIGNQPKTDANQFHFRGSAPLGNVIGPLPAPGSTQIVAGAPFNLGDPRNHAEQIFFDGNTANPVSVPRQTRWQPTNSYRGGSTNNDDQFIPRFNTLGLGNSFTINPTASALPGVRWTDPGTLQAGADTAQVNFPPPAPIPADLSFRPLTSIGQLGDLYDPVRAAPSLAEMPYSSGGGRTLRIGQPDGGSATPNPIHDGKPTSKSREWAAWRLADFFYAGDPRPGYDRAGNLAPAGQTEDLQLPGLINPNGLRRDGGAALRAVLEGHRFLTNGDLRDPAAPESATNPKLYLTDPALSGKALPASGRDALLTALEDRLKDAARGPLFERGELSELALFNNGTTLAGTDMAAANDRGREELFRRLVELVTTRGNVFTVYAVGEAITQTSPTAPKRVAGTARLKLTFALVPVFDPPLPSDDQYDPSSPTDARDPNRTIRRFRPPDRYEIQILRTST